MAKIKKRKLAWKSSTSAQVVGYKLYWSEGGKVDYDSPSAKLGNINEIVLPDDVEGFEKINGPVELGITAVDELGNESDLVTLKTPYQFNVPQAPSDLWIETLSQYHTTDDVSEKENSPEASIHLVEKRQPQPPQPAAQPGTSVSGQVADVPRMGGGSPS